MEWGGQSTYRGPLLACRAHRALASTLARKPNASCGAHRPALPGGALKTGKITVIVVVISGGFSSCRALSLSGCQHSSQLLPQEQQQVL